LPVFVCGEAFSNQQGWAEGALQSAECLLRENFWVEIQPKVES
jgi:lysine 2-monooxygenase